MLDLLRNLGIESQKASSTDGGEYHSPCPKCGGEDRFVIWPEESGGMGAYWCRGCGAKGDRIQFLRDFMGLSFKEAAAAAGKELKAPGFTPRRLSEALTPGSSLNPTGSRLAGFKPESPAPNPLWQQKCGDFVKRCRLQLLDNMAALAWLADRGITPEISAICQLGWNPGDKGRDLYRQRPAWGSPEVLKDDGTPKKLWLPIGLTIPGYNFKGDLIRLRIRRPTPGQEGNNSNAAAGQTLKGPRYYVLPGSVGQPSSLNPQADVQVIVESELDAVMIAGQTNYGAIGLGSARAKPHSNLHQILSAAKCLLIALDNDKPGAEAADFWLKTYPKARRWPVPGAKDPGEAFAAGLNLNQWIAAGLPYIIKPQPPKAIPIQGAPSSIPAPVSELGELLQRCWPVFIERNLETGVIEAIRCRAKFFERRHPREMRRISELVFGTPIVDHFLSAHPAAAEIDGRNYYL